MHRVLRTLRRPLRQLVGAAIELVLPGACALCGAPGAGLCAVCDRGLVRRPGGCWRCGEPCLAGDRCGREHRELRNLAFVVAPFAFAGSGGALVRRFKLDADAAAGRILARAMRQAWAVHGAAAWRRALLVPVPLHPSKRRRRGFDQAAWLAREVGRVRGVEWAAGVLQRCRATPAQGDPRTLSRERNVVAAFACSSPGRVAERRVVLVDDVFTSGATLRECARALRRAGAQQVAGLVACRS